MLDPNTNNVGQNPIAPSPPEPQNLGPHNLSPNIVDSTNTPVDEKKKQRFKNISTFSRIISIILIVPFPIVFYGAIFMGDTKINIFWTIIQFYLMSYPILFIIIMFWASYLYHKGKYKLSAIIGSIPVVITAVILILFIGLFFYEGYNETKQSKSKTTEQFALLTDQMKSNPDIFWNGNDRFIWISKEPNNDYGKPGRTVQINEFEGGSIDNTNYGLHADIGKITPNLKLIVYNYESSTNSIKKDFMFEGIQINSLNNFKNKNGKSILEIYPFDATNSMTD